MPGIIISNNGIKLAAVSTEGLNIVSANIVGDILGEELSSIQVHGGLYGVGENDKHLIWLSDVHLQEGDSVNIEFVASIENSHEGKTIEEFFPESGQGPQKQESLEELFNDLSGQAKYRNGFSFTLDSDDLKIFSSTESNVFSFMCSAMWRWLYPEELKISLSSNSLERIRNREGGISHGELRLKYGQSANLQIKST